MKRAWLMTAVVPVVVFIAGAAWLGARYRSEEKVESQLREKYSALERFGDMHLELRVFEKCMKDVYAIIDRTGIGTIKRGRVDKFDKLMLETAQKIQKDRCDPLPINKIFAKLKSDTVYKKRHEEEWRSLHHDLEKTLISLGRFEERNQVATERILWDVQERLSAMEEMLQKIERRMPYQ